MLTLYSRLAADFCADGGLPLPLAWADRCRALGTVRRFGTQPLRSWLAQRQQWQLRAALSLNEALDRHECALAVSHVNARRRASSIPQRSRRQSDLDSFLAHVDRLSGAVTAGAAGDAEGSTGLVLRAEVVGRPSSHDVEDAADAAAGEAVELRLPEFNVVGRAQLRPGQGRPVLGEAVRVRFLGVDEDGARLRLELLPSAV